MPPRRAKKAASKTKTEQEVDPTSKQIPQSSDPAPIPIQHSELETEEAFEMVGSALVEDLAKKTTDQEKKLNILLGGYIHRQRTLANKFTEANAAYQQSVIQRYIFEGNEITQSGVAMDEE